MIHSLVRALPYSARLAGRMVRAALNEFAAARSPYIKAFPAGHFYSPLPDLQEVRRREEEIFKTVDGVPGVILDEGKQIALLDALAEQYEEIPFPEAPRDGFRFFYPNAYFLRGEAVMLGAMLRHLRPRQIVEVGSGFSSAAMLDINDRFMAGRIRFTFVDPHAERLRSLLRPDDADRHTILPRRVQDADPSLFACLEARDVLFVDSSHVAKVGSDVVYLLHEVLPLLRPGVVVHFHDVYWPFEYPKGWVFGGRAWNEAYMLRCFLQFNEQFRILYFNDFMWTRHPELVSEKLPGCRDQAGAGLWIERV